MSTAVAIPAGSLFEITDHLAALFDSMEGIEDPALKLEAEADIQRFLEAEVRKVDGISGYRRQSGC